MRDENDLKRSWIVHSTPSSKIFPCKILSIDFVAKLFF